MQLLPVLAITALSAASFARFSRLSEGATFILFTASSAAVVYSLHRFVGENFGDPKVDIGRNEHLTEIRSVLPFVIFLSLLSAFTLLCFISLREVLLVIPVGVIVWTYIFPVFPGGVRLRDFPFVKLPLLTLTVTYVTYVIPMVSMGLPVELSSFTVRAAVVFGFTLPFEVRDFAYDQSCSTLTLAHSLSFQALISLSALSLIGATLLSETIDAIYIVSVLPVLVCCSYSQRLQWRDYQYLYEGGLILYGVLVVLRTYLKNGLP